MPVEMNKVMNDYQELTLIKSADISPHFIWSKLFTQVHLALVEQAKAVYGENAKHSDIGVSFPGYQCFEKNGKTLSILGDKLRVFANTSDELEQLHLTQKLKRLSDYVHIRSIDQVGNKKTADLLVKRFRQEVNMDIRTQKFARQYNKSFAEVKAARIQHMMDKHSLTETEARQRYANPVLLKKPYIKITSLENKNRFSLQIDQHVVDQCMTGRFNTYGLSRTATVPHW